MKKGKVYLIGAGPAGKELLTVRGLGILREADVVVYDYLTDKSLLSEIKAGAARIDCRDLGKDHEGTTHDAQSKINALLVAQAQKGRIVARLKTGDPFIFGRACEELAALWKNRIAFEVVPGVSAAQAAAAYVGIPLTDRACASSVVFVTGHEAMGPRPPSVDWKNIAGNGTIVLYMAVKNIAKIAVELIRAGKSPRTPIAAISNAGRINQKVVVGRLKDISAAIKKAGLVAPAVFIVGDVVAREKDFNWLKKNRRVLYTGTSGPGATHRGTVFHQPLIKVEPLEDYSQFDKHIQDIRRFHWIIFTSRYSVHYFFERLNQAGHDARILNNIKIAAIGAMTAKRLQDFGISADLIPRDESSRGLLAALRKNDLQGKRAFFPRSDIANKNLPQRIQDLGADVIVCDAYRNVVPGDLPDLDVGFFDEIVFTSPSGVRNFVKKYGKPPNKVKMKFIGDVTASQAQKEKLGSL